MHTLKNYRSHYPSDNTLFRRCNRHILWSDDCVNHRTMLDIVHTFKFCAAEAHSALPCHNAAKDIALSDKVGNKGIFGFIVNILRRTNLLNLSL